MKNFEEQGWDEFDGDDDDEELSDEEIQKENTAKFGENNNKYNKNENKSYSEKNIYYHNNGYNNPLKKYNKKRRSNNKKYYGGENYNNYKDHYNKQLDYKKNNKDFINTNANYMRKPSGLPANHYYQNKNYGYNNKGWNNNHNNYYSQDNSYNRKGIDDDIPKPMFTNSKLQNNSNPDANFIKIDVKTDEQKTIKSEKIGEASIIKSEKNEKTEESMDLIKKLLKGGEEKVEINKAKTIETEFGPDSWRKGGLGYKGEGYGKKLFYNKSYRTIKKDKYYNNFNYNNNSSKNFYRDYPLNQPQVKGNNRFDGGLKNG